jgi:hypothetical protein
MALPAFVHAATGFAPQSEACPATARTLCARPVLLLTFSWEWLELFWEARQNAARRDIADLFARDEYAVESNGSDPVKRS